MYCTCMYRSEQVGFGKRNRLIADLAAQIRSGRLARGDRLPGENQLARQYEVSRGTVRSALAELAQQDLIATQSGVGSFVTFDGVALDQSLGWATALARSGFEITTVLLGIERTTDSALSEAYRVAEFIAVRRLRRERAGGFRLRPRSTAHREVRTRGSRWYTRLHRRVGANAPR